jgi:hypothetical protein
VLKAKDDQTREIGPRARALLYLRVEASEIDINDPVRKEVLALIDEVERLLGEGVRHSSVGKAVSIPWPDPATWDDLLRGKKSQAPMEIVSHASPDTMESRSARLLASARRRPAPKA